MQCVKEGDSVVFDENGERKTIIKIKAGSNLKLGKGHVPLETFIGAPWGAVYTLSGDGRSAERINECPQGEYAAGQAAQVTEGKNNAQLFDRNDENQRLTAAEIEAMKKEGKDGKEILDALISNSATFHTKTEFAQEKYKKRKAKKHIATVTVRRPTARLLCEAYFEKGPDRFHYLRPDSLAVLLSLSNIAAGARVLVMDQCVGVVAAAVAERLGGFGTVCCAHVDKPVPTNAVHSLNLTEAETGIVVPASLSELKQLKARSVQPQAPAPPPAQVQADNVSPEENQGAGSAAEASPAAPSGTDGQQGQQQGQGQSHQAGQDGASSAATAHANRQKLLQGILEHGFDTALIVAPQLQAQALMQEVLPLLVPSATFAVFSSSPQPLAECLAHLQASKQAVMMQLQESWLRPYQVLPGRTHPHMMCSGTGGYILSGIKLAEDTTGSSDDAAAGSTEAASQAGKQKNTGGGSQGNSKRARR